MTAVVAHRMMSADPRLKRHIEHDDRSWQHNVAMTQPVVPIRTRIWARHSAILDQGNLGSCTGNAMAGWLACEPHCMSDVDGARFDEPYALELYHWATVLDAFTGVYPPTDTGSSGNGVAKAARKMGNIRSWSWTFTTNGLIRALMHGPVIVGIPWYESMYDPDAHGVVTAEGNIVGGHEVLIRGWDDDFGLFLSDNSWSIGWNPQLGGSFKFSRSTWDTAFRPNQADVTVPHV